MKCDVFFDLLYDLMDVSIEHGDRSEAPEQRERLLGIVGAPAHSG